MACQERIWTLPDDKDESGHYRITKMKVHDAKC